MADLWPIASRYLNDRNFVQKAQYEAPPQKTAADEQILQDQFLKNLCSNKNIDARKRKRFATFLKVLVHILANRNKSQCNHRF